MKHYTFNRWHFSLSEHRLVRFAEKIGNGDESLDTAYERVKDYEKIKKNKHFLKLATLYDNELTRVGFSDILQAQSSQRPYLLTLLYEGSLVDKGPDPLRPNPNAVAADADYATVGKENINPTDPFSFLEAFWNPPGAAGRAKFEKKLKDMLPDEVLEQIHPEGRNAPAGKLAESYRLIILNAGAAWENSEEMSNTIFVTVNLYYYREMQKELADKTRLLGVRPPNNGIDFAYDRGGDGHPDVIPANPVGDPTMLLDGDEKLVVDSLERKEYLMLLRRTMKNGGVENYIDKLEVHEGAKPDPASESDKRLNRMFINMSVAKFGPSETLNRFGIKISEFARSNYMDARSGIRRDSAGVEYPADVEPIPSAGSWPDRPDLAFAFLSRNMPRRAAGEVRAGVPTSGDSNNIFLESLRYHYIDNGPDGPPAGLKILSKSDTLTVVTLLSQSFMEYEGVRGESNRQREDLKKNISVVQRVEEFVPEAWNHMLDFSYHPVSSAAVGLAFVMSAKALVQLLKSKGGALTTPFGLAALWFGAKGMYDSNTKGHAWWNTLKDKYDDIMGNEKLTDPKQRTLANYWFRELKSIEGTPGQYDKLTNEKERLTLGLIGQEPTGKTLDWYEQYSQWHNNPSRRGGRRPPRVPFKYYNYLNIYGNDASNEEVSEYIYLSMHKFFTHRGRMVEQSTIPFEIPASMNGQEGMGFAYIKEKYTNKERFYRRLLKSVGMEAFVQLPTPEQLIATAEDAAAMERMKVNDPDMHNLLKKYAEGDAKAQAKLNQLLEFLGNILKKEDEFSVPSAGYPMDHVFFMEGNPELMSRIDREKADTAGYFDRFVNYWFGGQNPIDPNGNTPNVGVNPGPVAPNVGAPAPNAAPNVGAPAPNAAPNAGAVPGPAVPNVGAPAPNAAPNAGAASGPAAPNVGAPAPNAAPNVGAPTPNAAPNAGAASGPAAPNSPAARPGRNPNAAVGQDPFGPNSALPIQSGRNPNGAARRGPTQPDGTDSAQGRGVDTSFQAPGSSATNTAPTAATDPNSTSTKSGNPSNSPSFSGDADPSSSQTGSGQAPSN